MALPGSLGEDARHAAMTSHRGDCSWDIDHASCKWVVTLRSPDEQDFDDKTLEAAPAPGLGTMLV
jgi:hypothetical protein